MAEYAGLEIRIGGNTTKLTNALKAPTKSAAELQRRIRQITRAMQFDPTSLKNVDTRIRLTTDRMQSLQSKAKLVKTAMEQLGDSMVRMNGEDKSIKEIATETDNLSLKAKQADERFNQLTGTLAKIYEAWNNLSRDEGAEYLMQKLGFTESDARKLMNGTTTVRDFTDALREEQRYRSSIDYDGIKPLISEADIEKMKQFKELNFHDMFKRGLDLDDVIEDARNLGIVIEDSAIENVRNLQETFKEAQEEKKAFDDALKYDQGLTDLQRYESEIENLSQTARKLDDTLTPTTMSDGFQELEMKVRSIDASIENVNNDLKRTKDALDADPGNIELAARYFDDLRQKASLSEEKLNLLNQEMDMLDASGAKEAAEGHQDLAKWIEESAESARVAKKELSDQQAEVSNLEDEVKTLKQTIDTFKGDSTIAEYSSNVLQWKRQTEKLSSEMEKLATAEKRVAEQQAEFDKTQSVFDDADNDVKEYESRLKELRAELERVNTAIKEAFFSGSGDLDSLTEKSFQLENEISEVESAYRQAADDVDKFSSRLEDQKSNLDTAKDSLRQQKTAVDELKQSVADLEKTRDVKIFQNPGDEIEKAETELVKLEGQLEKATAKENELETAYKAAKTENEMAKTAQATREVGQAANDTEADLKKLGEEMEFKRGGILNPSTLKTIGMTLSATFTPALVGVGYKMVDASSTVDEAYRDMRKTVEGTEEQFEHLKSAAIEFSRTHVTSADQILQIEAIGGELGIATENLETFAEVISNIDVATNLDTESAAEALGHLSNILHLTEEDYVGFSDALVRLGNNGASTETEIANIAERIGSMGSIVGMSGSDILAWSSSLASTGQRAEAAATALSKTWSVLETSVAAAGGTLDTSFEAIDAAVQEGGDKLTVFANLAGSTADEFVEAWSNEPQELYANLTDQLDGAKDNLQMFADVAHMSADEFCKAWESDPTEAAKAFIQGLNDIEESGGSADAVLQSLGITAVRQKQGIEGLMQTIGGLDDNLKMSEDAWNGVSDKWGQAGDAANEAQKKAEGFSGQIQILKNMAQNFFAELGEGAVPWIKMLSDSLETATGAFSSLSSETKAVIVALGGIAAASGPVLSMTATFLTSKKEIKEWASESLSGLNVVKLAMKQGKTELVAAGAESITTMQKVGLVGAQLGSTLISGLQVALVIGSIAAIIAYLKTLYDRYQDHIAATQGLSDALANMGKVSGDVSDSFDAQTTSLGTLIEESDGYESRLADLAKTIEDSNRQYSTFAGSMDYYADIIKELGDKTERTQDETYKLDAALQAVNDACGTTYGIDEYGNIIETDTGKIVDNTEAIYDNIDARKQQALVEYYSDDYDKAVSQWAEANDRLMELQEHQNELADKDTYISERMEMNRGNRQQAEEVYRADLAQTEKAIEDTQAEMDGYQATIDATAAKISEAEEKQREYAETQKAAAEAAAKAQEDMDKRSETVTSDVTGNMKRMSDAVDALGKSDADFVNIADGLSAIHVSADELGNVDMSQLVTSFTDANTSMEQVVATLENGGVSMTTWNDALAQAPGAAENMGNVTAAAFQTMYETADSDINATMTLIAGLDAVQVNGKTFYIGDNGSIIDEQGQIYDINADIATIPDEVITTYYANDANALKKAMDMENKLREIDKQNPKPKADLQDNASPKAKSLFDKLKQVAAIKPTPTVSINDRASGTISAIDRDMNNLDGKVSTVYVKTVEQKVKQATGGLNSRAVVPEHASGYIATGPTMTNQGWIGEDGVEAVANWASGGVVVPLTNRKYMLPIADAIADGMTKRLDISHASNNVSIYVDGSSDPETVAYVIANKLQLVLDAR